MVHLVFYVANIIDYIRILLLVVGLATYDEQPVLFVVFYVISAILDGVDGMAARKLNQSNFYSASDFGMILDMSIDRVSFALICVLDSIEYQ